jgi:hypothetical protein
VEPLISKCHRRVAHPYSRVTSLVLDYLQDLALNSSSGVIAKVLADLRRLENPETPAVLSILVLAKCSCSELR